jgi:iron complex transport system substrate-binding protein
MKKTIATILSVVILGSFVGCSAKKDTVTNQNETIKSSIGVKENSNSTVYPIKITNFDSAGKAYEQTFDKEPEKIVSMFGTTTELLCELGLEEKIIGAVLPDGEATSALKAKYDKIPKVFKEIPSEETVIGLEPDFIVGLHPAFMAGRPTTKSWNDKGIKTYKISSTMDIKTVDNHLKNIEDLGKILGEEKRISQYVNEQKERIKLTKEALKDMKDTPKVLIVQKSGDKYYSYTAETLAGNLAEQAGIKLGDYVPKQAFGLENLISINPDVIIYGTYYGTDADKSNEQKKEGFMKETSLQSINAIKNNRVLVVDFGEMTATGSNPSKTIEKYARFFYPSIEWDKIFSGK